ncbi:TlpA disulfide reductase family protein [Alteribacillus sp. JSM 102045]|uniref:TlpA disulfide reductase family protein n=1 Tax=Alteribacillus sp. JSM 102045 TaxID=1562101 RepID=UPI0035C23CAC
MNAPLFELKEMFSEKTVRLSMYKGKPLMLTFWASWCPDSQKDLAQKQRFYEHLDQNQLEFLTINVSGREGKVDDAKKLMNQESYTFPVLVDNGTKTYDRYQCMGVPTTFIIDENQRIVDRFNDKAAFVDIVRGMNKIIRTK